MKIENLEKDVNVKTQLINENDEEIETMKTKYQKIKDDYRQCVNSEEKIRCENKNINAYLGNKKKEILEQDQKIADDYTKVMNLHKEIDNLKQEIILSSQS